MVSGTELRLESKALTVQLVLIQLWHSRDQLKASTSNVWTVPLGSGNFSRRVNRALNRRRGSTANPVSRTRDSDG